MCGYSPRLRGLWSDERREQVTECHHGGSNTGLHGSERLAQPDGDLAVTQPLIVGNLDDLALLRAEEGEGALHCPLYVSHTLHSSGVGAADGVDAATSSGSSRC